MISHEKSYPLLNRHPEIGDIIKLFGEFVDANTRPPDQTILRDPDAMRILGVCKRQLRYMKKRREIPYHDPPGQRDYFLLSDILNWLKKYRVESIDNMRRI